MSEIKVKNKAKIPHYRNNSNIKYQNHRKRQNRYPWRTNTWPPLTFLDQYRHFN